MPNAHSLTPTEYPHIPLNSDKIPLIAGKTMKVVELVVAQRAYGWTPEEIQINHRHLSRGQIYAALAYYWDHREALGADMQRHEAYVTQLERQAEESPFVIRLNSSLYQKGISLTKQAMVASEERLERNPLLPKWDILIRPVSG